MPKLHSNQSVRRVIKCMPSRASLKFEDPDGIIISVMGGALRTERRASN